MHSVFFAIGTKCAGSNHILLTRGHGFSVVEPFFGLNGDLDDWNLGPKISTKLGQREAGKIRNFFDHDTSRQPAPARLDHDANQQNVN